MIRQGIGTWLLGCGVIVLLAVACGDDDPAGVDPNAAQALGTITMQGTGGATSVFDSLHLTTSLLGPDLVVLETDVSDTDDTDLRKHHVLLMDSSHPAFADVVARLTDGADGNAQIRFDFGGGFITYVGTLSNFLDFHIARAGGEPDFVGYEITALRWSVALATFDSPGNDLNHNGIWTDYSVQIQIDVEGRPQ